MLRHFAGGAVRTGLQHRFGSGDRESSHSNQGGRNSQQRDSRSQFRWQKPGHQTGSSVGPWSCPLRPMFSPNSAYFLAFGYDSKLDLAEACELKVWGVATLREIISIRTSLGELDNRVFGPGV